MSRLTHAARRDIKAAAPNAHGDAARRIFFNARAAHAQPQNRRNSAAARQYAFDMKNIADKRALRNNFSALSDPRRHLERRSGAQTRPAAAKRQVDPAALKIDRFDCRIDAKRSAARRRNIAGQRGIPLVMDAQGDRQHNQKDRREQRNPQFFTSIFRH